jgi:hypothetical protein
MITFAGGSFGMTKWELASFMFHKGNPIITFPDGKGGIFQGALRESGSGNTFTIHYLDAKNEQRWAYVKTVD